MKKTFWALTSFILISFFTMGVLISSIAHKYIHSSQTEKINRDLEIIATISQGAFVSNDYERIEEEIMLWGEKDKSIIRLTMSLDNSEPLIDFDRNIEVKRTCTVVHSVNVLNGNKVNFKMVYDLTEHSRKTIIINIAFFSLATFIALLFILSLWFILQRFAIKPLKNELEIRRKTEKDLILAKEKAEESARLKSAFLANMSHEIRTPMNGILGFAELLKQPKLSGESQNQYLKIIEKSGERMLNLINDLMDISKIESGQMPVFYSEVDINKEFNELLDFFKPEADTQGLKISFANAGSSKGPILKTDKKKFDAILLNLIKNALKYTNEGKIEFGYSTKPEIEGKNNESEVIIYVKDTGIGIAKEKVDSIFKRFVQADLSLTRPYEGVGLGLSIAQAYIEMLGGRIWAESEIDKGSTFYFTVPLNQNLLIESEENEIPSSDTDQKELLEQYIEKENKLKRKLKDLKVLIAEDEDVGQEYLKILMKNLTRELIIVSNGADAVDICRKHKDIDLILMDIRMPEMNGYEATRQIRTFNKDSVIIAQTAFALAGDREKTIEVGCNDYLTKPVNKKELFTLIEKHLIQ